ncbi:MAG: hypothetical protein EOO27_38075, partial [Comamonadaceae bacterium]
MEFIAIADKASQLAKLEKELECEALEALVGAAEKVGRAWSMSNLGYQANVYYTEFQVPPPGAMFSREWGFEGRFQGTVGDWHIYSVDEVISYIEQLADCASLDLPRTQSSQARLEVEDVLEQARSAAAKLAGPHDDYLRRNLEDLQSVLMPDEHFLTRAQMKIAKGQFAVRDMRAFEGGWQPAGHQIVLARAFYLRSPYVAARELTKICKNIGRHLEGEDSAVGRAVVQLGTTV